MRTTGSTGVPVATGLRSRVSGVRSQVSGVGCQVSGTGDGRQKTGDRHLMDGGHRMAEWVPCPMSCPDLSVREYEMHGARIVKIGNIEQVRSIPCGRPKM